MWVRKRTYVRGGGRLLRLLFYTFANKSTGLGHWFRCLALAEAALNRGHKVAFASDRKPPFGMPFYPSVYLLEDGFVEAYNHFYPEWIVADLPVSVPDFVMNLPTRKCLIDGIGHDAQAKADLNISQGLDGTGYCAPDYVLIRNCAMLPSVSPKPIKGVFVFGGGADKLGLTKRFIRACSSMPANIVISPLAQQFNSAYPVYQIVYSMDDNRIFSVMRQSTSAVVHMGMICWETCFYGIAPHIFSYSLSHLASAKAMENAEYALAFDYVGLPEEDTVLLDFIRQPVILRGKSIDGRGAERVIKLMERRG